MKISERIKAALSRHTRTSLPSGPVPAAVLLPIYRKNGQYHILFTKRTHTLNHHRGEISFPGGAVHPEDRDTLDAALRETWEETGIEPSQVEVLGVLDDVVSVHNYLVTPYVGLVEDGFTLRINPCEIERVIEVPVAHLLRPEIYRQEDWNWKGRTLPVDFYLFGSDEIWGLTAAILKQFLHLTFARTDFGPPTDDPRAPL